MPSDVYRICYWANLGYVGRMDVSVGWSRSRGFELWRVGAIAKAWWLVVVVAAVSSSGCALVYPEVATPLRDVPEGVEASPEPPNELLYVRFVEVVIPERTRDGRSRDGVGGSLPDPTAKLIVGEKTVVLETPRERNTLVATWPDQIRANYLIPRDRKLRVEIWDQNTLTNKPICVKPFSGIHDEAEFGELRLRCENGTRIVLQVEPAHARWGLGMSYEIGGGVARITKVFRHSPATRAGLAEGDQILTLDGVSVATMDPQQVTSAINSKSRQGVPLQVRTSSGRTRQLTLKEGPIYPVKDELVLER